MASFPGSCQAVAPAQEENGELDGSLQQMLKAIADERNRLNSRQELSGIGESRLRASDGEPGAPEHPPPPPGGGRSDPEAPVFVAADLPAVWILYLRHHHLEGSVYSPSCAEGPGGSGSDRFSWSAGSQILKIKREAAESASGSAMKNKRVKVLGFPPDRRYRLVFKSNLLLYY